MSAAEMDVPHAHARALLLRGGQSMRSLAGAYLRGDKIARTRLIHQADAPRRIDSGNAPGARAWGETRGQRDLFA